MSEETNDQQEKDFDLTPSSPTEAGTPGEQDPQPELPISNPQPAIEKMEIQHPHHIHHKKRWKDYFFEFLMLFLAVTLGFFVENQREHYIERLREKQYMESLVEDLKKDTTILKDKSWFVLYQKRGLDSLVEIIHQPSLDRLSIQNLYRLQQKYIRLNDIHLIDRTALQLKNAGTMRLIKDKIVADSIVNYWSATEDIYKLYEIIETYRHKAKDIGHRIFNTKYYYDRDSYMDAPTMENPELMTSDKNTLYEFANRIVQIKDNMKIAILTSLDEQFTRSVNLINLIRKEYQLP